MSYTNEEHAVLTALHNAIVDGRIPLTVDPHEIVNAWKASREPAAPARPEAGTEKRIVDTRGLRPRRYSLFELEQMGRVTSEPAGPMLHESNTCRNASVLPALSRPRASRPR